MIRQLKENFNNRNYKQFVCKVYEKRDMYVKKDDNGLFFTICLQWNKYVKNAFTATIYYNVDTRSINFGGIFSYLNRNIAELIDREDYWWDIESNDDIADFFSSIDVAEQKMRNCTDIEQLISWRSTSPEMEIDKEVIHRFLNKTEPAPVEHTIKREIKAVPLLLFHLAEDVLSEMYPDNGNWNGSVKTIYYSENNIISHALEAYRQIMLM